MSTYAPIIAESIGKRFFPRPHPNLAPIIGSNAQHIIHASTCMHDIYFHVFIFCTAFYLHEKRVQYSF